MGPAWASCLVGLRYPGRGGPRTPGSRPGVDRWDRGPLLTEHAAGAAGSRPWPCRGRWSSWLGPFEVEFTGTNRWTNTERSCEREAFDLTACGPPRGT